MLQSIPISIVFGFLFDHIVGQYIGVFSYKLGFGPFFLFFNGALSYGFMFANVMIMRDARFFHFYFWTIFIGIVYEITNFYLPVWNWEYGNSYFEYGTMIFAGYSGISFLMAYVIHVFLKTHFHFVDYVLKK